MNMEEQLRAVVDRATIDGDLWHTIIHGNNTTEIQTENGKVPSAAKQLKDVRDAIMGGVVDVISVAESARDATIIVKEQTEAIKIQTQEISNVTKAFRDETETFKDLSQTTFTNIATATSTAVSTIQNETASQIVNVQTSAKEQINLAKNEADRSLYYAQSASPTPLGSKLTVPASAKIPDGYEPTWYKNTITRARYPDFFEKMVDANELFCLDEAAYDAQVAEYGMCNAYVKIDEDTLILPLLLHYGRSGTLTQVGQVQKDQFQGHFHESAIRTDVYGSGDGKALMDSSGADEGIQTNGPNMNVGNPSASLKYGAPRFGDETRPKSYFELTYIKCADVVRPLAVEETSEIRNLCFSKVDTSLANLESYVLQNKLFTVYKNGENWYHKRKADGFIVQSGKMPITTWDSTSHLCNLVIPFVGTQYGVFMTPETYQCHWSTHVSPHYWNKTITSFNTCNHVAYVTGVRWVAFGY